VRVALFVTCFNDTLFPEVGKSVVSVLERLGCEVVFPMEQTCCGQVHLNTGYQPEAKKLAERFTRVFSEYDAIVTPSGACAGTVRDGYPTFLGLDGPPLHEFTEFLVDVLGVTDVGASYPHRVTYHSTCHSLRALKVADRPYQLLKAVRGLELVELPSSEECCGFGGTFSVKNPDVSAAMLADKMRHIMDTGAEVVTAVDTSCLMHIGGGLKHSRAGVRTTHIAEILAST
jgi:L-lactate dehydrogenase complex protein LldE